MKFHPRAGAAALLLLLPWLAQADIVASLDRHQAQLGDTLTLNLQATGNSQLAMPDLAPLQRDFAILGTSNSSSVQIVNGVRTASSTLGVALQPLHAGHLLIPALRVGAELTQPLSVDVTAAASAGAGYGNPAASAQDRPIMLEGSVAPASVYVGQQAIYTLRLLYAANIANGALDDPQGSGLDVHRLGGDSNYQTVRGGRRYNVVERRYVLTPEHAGTLRIPPLQFQGQVVDPNDPDAFFGALTPTRAVSAPVQLQVSPIPPNWGQTVWLPSTQVQLSLAGLPASGEVQAGQPLTVSMRLQARGVSAAALPDLSMPALNGAQVYPDKASRQDQATPQGVVGIREQRFAIVPTQAGKLVLPETTIKWWNLNTHQAEYARIPARTLTVLAAAGGPSAPASVAAPASAHSAAAPAAPVRPDLWRGLSYLLLGLWLLTMLLGLWWWRRRRRPVTKVRVEPSLGPAAATATAAATAPAKPAQLQQRLLQAARAGEPGAVESSLLAWARAERPGIRQLGDLQQALTEGPQTLAIAQLQRARYAGGSFEGEALATAFAAGFDWRAAHDPGASASGLPPLYPFKLD